MFCKFKLIFATFLLMSSVVLANDEAQFSGMVEHFDGEQKTITIDGTVYPLAPSVKIHRPPVRGEYGYSIPAGWFVSFNLSDNVVSEIWVLK